MVENKKVLISDLHFEHKDWIRQLDFYKDEVAIFENRLGDLVQRYTSQGILAQLERFQNQFIRQKEVIDILLHDIGVKERELEAFAKEFPNFSEQAVFNDHTKLREEMQMFYKLYTDLKKEFIKLLVEIF